MQSDQPSPRLSDPDPFTIAALWLTAAGVALQFAQFWTSLRGSAPQENPASKTFSAQSVSMLEAEVRELSAQLRTLTRAIERESPDSDAQYYNVPFRIGRANLMVAGGIIPPIQSLGISYMRLGNMANGINQIVATYPSTAYRLGAHMKDSLNGTAEALNRAMADGAPNRTIQAEGRRALEALAAAIEAELGGSN